MPPDPFLRLEVRRVSVDAGPDQHRSRIDVELKTSRRRERLPAVVVDDRVGAAGTRGQLHEITIGGLRHLDPVDLIVLLEAKQAAVVRRVVGKANAVGGKKAADAEPDAPLGLPGHPVLVRIDLRLFDGRLRLPADLPVSRPAVLAKRRDEVGIHEQVPARLGARHRVAQVRRPELQAELHRPELVAERTPEERLLAGDARGSRRIPAPPAARWWTTPRATATSRTASAGRHRSASSDTSSIACTDGPGTSALHEAERAPSGMPAP